MLVLGFVDSFFDTRDFPARWHCGRWTDLHGWTHVISDILIFLAYMSIPAAIAFGLYKRRDVPSPLAKILVLFVGFIVSCGLTHLNDAIIFWDPIYRIQGITKAATAVLSWVTVAALIPAFPRIMSLKSPESLEKEVEKKTRELTETEALFRDLYENAPDICVYIDAKNGEVIRCNATAARVLGYSKDELVGRQIFGFCAPQYRDAVRTLLSQFLDAETLSHEDLVLQTKAGDDISVSLSATALRDADGNVLYIRSSWRNLDDSKRAEVLFERAVDASPSGMVAVDDNGVIALVNAETERLFGYSRFELIGKPVEKLLPEAYQKTHPAWVSSFITDPERRAMGAGRSLFAQRKDGTTFPVEIGLNPIDTGQGRWVLGAVVDRTEVVETQKRLEEQAEELKRSNVELEQFAYVASHDLQEPLRMVAGFSKMLSRQYSGQLDATGQEYLHYLVDGAKRMEQLINELLEYSRVSKREVTYSTVDANASMDSVCLGLQMSITESCGSVVYTGLPEVVTDQVQFCQVLQNLVSNGLKFRGDKPPRVEVTAQRDDDQWTFCVADDGIGIASDQWERIFEMFQRLHERDIYDGSGIGLALVKKMVERWGGKVWVQSTLGEGSSFFFTVPVRSTGY